MPVSNISVVGVRFSTVGASRWLGLSPLIATLGSLPRTRVVTPFTDPAGFREAGPESAYFDNVVITGTGGSTLFRDSFDDGLGAWRLPAGSGYGAFAGLHLFDEPSVARLPLVAKAVAMANDAYADALSYVNLFPGFGAGYEQAARDIDSPVLSFDRYPILASGEDLGYFDNWAQVRAAALKHGRDPWIYIQSVGYANHAIPTKADLLWQISISLAYGCKGIQYFTYWTPDPARGEAFTNGLITVEGKRTGLYRDTKQVNADYLAPLGKQMLELTSTAGRFGRSTCRARTGRASSASHRPSANFKMEALIV